MDGRFDLVHRFLFQNGLYPAYTLCHRLLFENCLDPTYALRNRRLRLEDKEIGRNALSQTIGVSFSQCDEDAYFTLKPLLFFAHPVPPPLL